MNCGLYTIKIVGSISVLVLFLRMLYNFVICCSIIANVPGQLVLDSGTISSGVCKLVGVFVFFYLYYLYKKPPFC